MISLRAVTMHEITLPLREPFRISSGTEIERRILLLQLEEADGAVVWSECVAGAAPNYSPEYIDTAWGVTRDWLVPILLHKDFAHPSDVSAFLNDRVRGHLMAKAALEMGVWALYAAHHSMSLTSVLGGTRSQVATGISIGLQTSPEELVSRAVAAHQLGYQKIKVKVARGKDVAYVDAVRNALPTQPTMVDANTAYTLADLDILSVLDEYGLSMIEQPLAWDDLREHAQLQQTMKTPICLDESITSVSRAVEMVERGAGRIINIKPGRVGGFGESKRIHDVCSAHSIPVWCGGMLESGIGRAYNVAMASLPNFSMPGDLSPSRRYWEEDLVEPEWTMSADGFVTVPTQPGIGVTVNEDRIKFLTRRSEVCR